MALPTTSPNFWNRIARRYSRSKIADEAAYAHKLQITQSFLSPDMSVLELGCGTGGTARTHAPKVAQYHATDFANGMIEIARERHDDAAHPNLTYAVAAVEDMSPDAQRYDAVLALSLLHLVADVPAALAKIHALLSEDGVFVSSTACLSEFAWPLRLLISAGRFTGFVPPVQQFSAPDLRQMIADAGFEITYDWAPGPKTARFLVARKV